MLHARGTVRAVRKARGATTFHKSTWQRRQLLTLAIETSCDDTAVAVLKTSSSQFNNTTTTPDGTSFKNEHASRATIVNDYATQSFSTSAHLLFNEKVTARNTGRGGIHPIEALASHQASLSQLVSKAIGSLPNAQAQHPSDSIPSPRVINYGNDYAKRLPDFISVTRGPGMRSNLQCGLDTAKGLAAAWQVPLVGVHHMQAHALTPRLVAALEQGNHKSVAGTSGKSPKFPFLTLLASGGHTMLLHSTGLVDHKILASTRDVAIGDALDKCGRVILPDDTKAETKDTAFARYLSDYAFPSPDAYDSWSVPRFRRDEIAKPPNQYNWQVQAPLADTKDLTFSFTSIATTIERLFRQRLEQGAGSLSDEERILFARTALGIAFEHLASRTIIALESLHKQAQDVTTLVVSGGVAANAFLRHFLRKMLDIRGYDHVQLLFPPPSLCTDNAAMIAWCGLEMYEAGYYSELGIEAFRKWSMDPTAADGGILGVGGWTSR